MTTETVVTTQNVCETQVLIITYQHSVSLSPRWTQFGLTSDLCDMSALGAVPPSEYCSKNTLTGKCIFNLFCLWLLSCELIYERAPQAPPAGRDRHTGDLQVSLISNSEGSITRTFIVQSDRPFFQTTECFHLEFRAVFISVIRLHYLSVHWSDRDLLSPHASPCWAGVGPAAPSSPPEKPAGLISSFSPF